MSPRSSFSVRVVPTLAGITALALVTTLVIAANSSAAAPSPASSPAADSRIAASPRATPSGEPNIAAEDVAYVSGYSEGKGNQLFSTDGTSGGTKLVSDLFTAGGRYVDLVDPEFTTIGARTLFAAHGATTGDHIWVTDGTAAGTRQLTGRTKFPAGSSPEQITALGDTFYFSGQTTNPKHYRVLYQSDGTKAGTKVVPGIVGRPGEPSYSGTYPDDLTVVGSKLYFTTRSATFAPSSVHTYVDLWSTDGVTTKRELTTSRLHLLKNYLVSVSEMGGKLIIITGANSTLAEQVWVYDGSALKPLSARYAVDGLWSPEAASFDGSLFYSSSLGGGAWHLTRLTPNASPKGAVPDIINVQDELVTSVVAAGRLWYVVKASGDSEQLWTMDSADAVPMMVEDFGEPGFDSDLSHSVVRNAELYFDFRDTLWKSDGTTAGTRVIHDLGTVDGSERYNERFALAGNAVAVSYQDDSARPNLWITDGTPAGTHRVLPYSVIVAR